MLQKVFSFAEYQKENRLQFWVAALSTINSRDYALYLHYKPVRSSEST